MGLNTEILGTGKKGNASPRNGNKGRSRTLLATMLLVLMAMACGNPEDPGLVVYTYDSFPGDLEEMITAHFATEFDQALTFVREDDTGGLFNRLLRESSRPQADVVIGLDNTYIHRAFREELLENYRSPRVARLPEGLEQWADERATVFDYGRITFNYDTQQVDWLPSTWQDLLDPRLQGAIVIPSPASSSPGRNLLLWTISVFGEEGYLDFWESFKPQILTIAPGWSQAYGLFTQGEAALVLSYETSPAYHILYEDSRRYDNIILDGAAFGQIEYAALVRGSRRRALGEQLIDYLLSVEIQEAIPANQFMYPVNPEARVPEAFLLPNRARTTLGLDPELVESRYDSWLQAWEEVMR